MSKHSNEDYSVVTKKRLKAVKAQLVEQRRLEKLGYGGPRFIKANHKARKANVIGDKTYRKNKKINARANKAKHPD